MSSSDVWKAIKEMERIVLLDTETERETSLYTRHSSAHYMRDRISEAYSFYLRRDLRGSPGSVIHHPTPWEDLANDVARAISPSSLKKQQLAAFLVVYGKLFGWTKRDHMNVAVQELFDHLPGERKFSTEGLEQSYEQHMRNRLTVLPRAYKLLVENHVCGGSAFAIWSFAKEMGAVGHSDEGEETKLNRVHAFYFRSYADYLRGVDVLTERRLAREPS